MSTGAAGPAPVDPARGGPPPARLVVALAVLLLGGLIVWAWRQRAERVGVDGSAAGSAEHGAAPAAGSIDSGGYRAPVTAAPPYLPPATLRELVVTGGLAADGVSPLDPAAAPSSGAGLSQAEVLARLQAPLPARDPARLARELGRLTGDVATAVPKARRLGDREAFWLHDIQQNQYLEVEARLLAISPHAYGWLQADQSTDEAALIEGVAAFDAQVYPRLRQAFGTEAWPGVDGDPRLHILHHQPIAGVAGYFYSVDEQPRTVDPHSNAREMFYINLEAFTPGSRDYLALLAHEFQHMIHWHQDPSESVWLNEGLSELAPHLVGLGVQTGRLYLSRPDTPLLEWTSDPGDNAEHYAASFAFCAYLWERYGEPILGKLTARSENGAQSVSLAVAELDAAAPSFDALFLDWTVANLLPETWAPSLPPRYRQAPAVDLRVDPEPLPPLPARSEVSPYGVDYWDLTAAVRRGRLALDFSGAAEVPLLSGVVEEGDPVWWSGRDENMASGLVLSLEPAAGERLEGRLWRELEEDWDYAYLQASTDGGETWRNLGLAGSRSQNPNGNNLGLGLSGRSQGWEDWSLDLTPFAGAPLLLRWLVLTDDAVSESGLALDGVRLLRPGADDVARSFPAADPAWQATGWQVLPRLLPQRWGLQVLVRGHEAWALRRFAVDATGRAAIALADIPDDATVTLIVSAMTPGTRSSAAYEVAAAGR